MPDTELDRHAGHLRAAGASVGGLAGPTPQKHISISFFYGDIPTLLGFFIRGFIWDIPILIFAYVLFWGPMLVAEPKVSTSEGTGWKTALTAAVDRSPLFYIVVDQEGFLHCSIHVKTPGYFDDGSKDAHRIPGFISHVAPGVQLRATATPIPTSLPNTLTDQSINLWTVSA